jgi:WD40 repeat protein
LAGSLAFSPDNRFLLIGSAISKDVKGLPYAMLWDRQTREKKLLPHADNVVAVAFSPDGTQALTGGRDAVAKLWSVATGKLLQTFEGQHTSWITGVAFTPDGKSVLTTGKDAKVILWNATTGKVIREFLGHSDWVNNGVFTGDGKRLFTASDDKTVRQWDVQTGDPILPVIEPPYGVNCVDASADGQFVALGLSNSVVEIRKMGQTSPLASRKLQEAATAILFTPDYQLLLISDYRGNVYLWDWKADRILWGEADNFSYGVITRSLDGQFVAIGREEGVTIFAARDIPGLVSRTPTTITPTAIPTQTSTPTP